MATKKNLKTTTKKQATAKKTSERKKTTVKEKPAAKKSTAKKTAAKKKPAAKKTTTKKKTATKKTPAKKASAKKATAGKSSVAIKGNPTKTQLMQFISDNAGITKKEAQAAFDAMNDCMAKVMKASNAEFTIPGILKIKKIRKPAKKARKGISPFTGEETMFKAKPAHNVLKARFLKAAKEMV